MINALNSGAGLHGRLRGRPLADLGERRRRPDHRRRGAPPARPHQTDGKAYRLNDETATLVLRPRGWHLRREARARRRRADLGQPVRLRAVLLPQRARAARARQRARTSTCPSWRATSRRALWNDVFVAAQDALGIPRGTIRATVLIETILAAFEMDEILYELREHAAGLNAGRWDYIFSIIKKFRTPAGHGPARPRRRSP